ncbi:hypothetical protein [Pseudoalteromonas sp. SSM20]|uniref:hypothetical protein n=1 Tax=Pseudoalteromonas sp. SSM20 TaxID=3139394 RepID=UPI003BACE7B7
MPQKTVSKFLSSMKDKNYKKASEYISKSDLTWLAQSTIPLLNNSEFLDMYGLEKLTESDIKELNHSDIFELWSYIAWESRDKNFGNYVPENVLGTVKENSNIAHVVVRDIASSEHEAEVYSLELVTQSWQLKLPRIIRGTLSVYEKSFLNK